jgi:hypothetical protein
MESKKRFYEKIYKGKAIYITNWSDFHNEDDLIKAIWETTELMKSMNKNELLELVIFKNSIVSKDVLLTMQKAAKVARPYNKKKAGVTDFSTTRLYILKTINLFSQDKIEPFNSEEEALEWLVK